MHRGVHALSQRATVAYERARTAIKAHLGADDNDPLVAVQVGHLVHARLGQAPGGASREDAVRGEDADGPGPLPVLFTRTPYHRAGALGSAKTYTDWGYAYVAQDCRGKYDSEGEFEPLVDEARDGHDTLDWIAGQTWCNGRIGLTGRSYLGIVQIPAASGGHGALRCIVPGRGSPGISGRRRLRRWR